jgi:hypothetical protein
MAYAAGIGLNEQWDGEEEGEEEEGGLHAVGCG